MGAVALLADDLDAWRFRRRSWAWLRPSEIDRIVADWEYRDPSLPDERTTREKGSDRLSSLSASIAFTIAASAEHKADEHLICTALVAAVQAATHVALGVRDGKSDETSVESMRAVLRSTCGEKAKQRGGGSAFVATIECCHWWLMARKADLEFYPGELMWELRSFVDPKGTIRFERFNMSDERVFELVNKATKADEPAFELAVLLTIECKAIDRKGKILRSSINGEAVEDWPKTVRERFRNAVKNLDRDR